MSALPAPLSELSRLATANQKAAGYFAPLLDSDDDVLRVGAWCILLERGEIAPHQYERAIELARYGAIRPRAFRFFQSSWEHDYAARIAALPGAPEIEAETRAMQAALDCDAEAAVEAERLKYLATGNMSVLQHMVTLAEEVGGWRQALPVAVKMVVLYPHDAAAASDLLYLLNTAQQPELMQAAIEAFEARGLHPVVTLLYSAALSLMRGNPRQALQRLQKLGTVRADMLLKVMRRNLAMRLTAEALEKLGDYRKAFAAYSELKKPDRGEPVRLDQYYAMIKRGEALQVPPLPADPRSNFFVMTGFARSGTTLLENMLGAHPGIETFEETPAGSSMQHYIDRVVPQAHGDAALVEA
jgi:hypothetical protein